MLSSKEEVETAINCFNNVSGYLIGVVSSLPEDEWCTTEEVILNCLDMLGEFLQGLETDEC